MTVALLAGLGNPGPSYEQTRHNAGFWFIDELLRRYGGALRGDRRHGAELGSVQIGAHRLQLVKPMTFMNRSGEPLASVARFYRIPPEQILVVHDELDLPPGIARIKQGGGHGGHNGLRSIIQQLSSQGFRRLRIGIGHPGPGNDVVGYVLRKPAEIERLAIDAAMQRAADVLPDLLDGRVEQAMHRLHSKPPEAG